MNSPPLPTAAEMRAVYVEDLRFGSKAGISDFRFMDFAHKHWPAIIAMREELDRLRASHRECEDRLVYISNFLKKDARDVRGDGSHTIATLVSQEFADLEKQLAESRAECERLRKDSGNYRGCCDLCGTANMLMLTDSYCAACRVADLEHQLAEAQAECEHVRGNHDREPN